MAILGLAACTPIAIAPARSAEAAGQRGGVEPRYVEPPRVCYYLTGLAVDYLNDDVLPPHALSISSGTLESGTPASFVVYGLNYYGSYWNLTGYFKKTSYSPRALRVNVEPAPGSASVAGRFRLVRGNSATLTRVVYVPRRKMRVDRTAVITFTMECDRTWTSQFTLSIPAASAAEMPR